MHVIIITKDSQIFECETDNLEGEAKEKVNEYVRNAVDTLDYVFWKNDVHVLNTFDDRKDWEEEAKKAEDDRMHFEELKMMFE